MPTKPHGHNGKKCGAKKRGTTGTCTQPAGWGTTHLGYGKCKLHYGSTPSLIVAAQKELALERAMTYGLPHEIDPRDALLLEVHRTAGHIAWLSDLVASLDHGGVGYRREETEDGGEQFVPLSGLKQLSRDGKFEKAAVWVELYQAERRHLREVCRDAIAAGIEERRVRLAEEHGALLAAAVRGMLGDLGLSPDQWALVPTVVPRHLRAATAIEEKGAP